MRDPKTENYLNRGQWVWVYDKHVEFNQIDVKASEENPARLKRRLDDDRAVQYGCDMESGIEFPGIVLLNHSELGSTYRYIIATGVHRTKGAILANRTWLDAYIVTEPDIYRREVLTRQINAIEGRGITIAEQIEHVLELKSQYPGKSIKDLAKEWNLKETTLQNALYEQRARARARNFDFDLGRLPQKSVLALGTIHSDVVFQEATKFITMVPCIQSAEIKEMTTEIKEKRDEKSQLAVVEAHRRAAEERIERTKAKHGRIKPTAINRLISDCKRLNNQLEKPYDEIHVAALEDRPGALRIARVVIENLKRLIVEIERVERMSKPVTKTASPSLHAEMSL